MSFISHKGYAIWDGISIIFILYVIQCSDTFSIYIYRYIYISFIHACAHFESHFPFLMLEQQIDQRSNPSCDKSSSPVFSQAGPWKCCWLPQFNLIQTLLVGGQRDGVRSCLQCQGWVWSSETSFFRQKCY